MLKNMQEENEGTDEGAVEKVPKGTDAGSVADVYDTNIRTFSKSITGGKTWQ